MTHWLPVLILALGGTLAPAVQGACAGAPRTHEATPRSVAQFVQHSGKKVLTFTGYSAAGYQDGHSLREHAARILAASDPGAVLVNIGATAEGIGAVYEWAKAAGFTTMGIVSSLARTEGVPLSPCVDHVFFVDDTTWGGLSPATGRLSPTSQAIVSNSSSIVGIGGGDVARDEMLAAQARGTPVTFIPAEMDHAIARARAEKRQQPAPRDFRGSAHAALLGGR